MAKGLEHDVTSILVLFIVAAVIANLITHGSATAMVVRPLLQFLNSGLSIASGGPAKNIAG